MINLNGSVSPSLILILIFLTVISTLSSCKKEKEADTPVATGTISGRVLINLDQQNAGSRPGR